LRIKEDNNNRRFLFFAIGYGIIASFLHVLVTFAWVLFILYAVSGLTKNNKFRIWQTVIASPFMEIWGRMARAPLLPIELGKYFILLSILLLLMIWFREKSKPTLYHTGKIILLVLLPSFVYALITVPFNYEDWVFNVVGVVAIAFLLMFAAKERWSENQLLKCLTFSVYIIIPVLLSITLKTPDYDNVNFNVGAVGFAPNQVSTILGAAMFVLVIAVVLNRPIFKPAAVNYIIIGYIFLRGLLTFSRGGMIVAVISVLILLFPIIFKNKKAIIQSFFVLSITAMCGAGVFFFANKLSGDHLLQRYKGDTKGTLSGDKEKTINTFTNGRFGIATTDLKIFVDHPVMGVGPGQARYLREKYGGFEVIAHVEFSRLLSEHGIGGLLVVLILVLFSIARVITIKSKIGKAISAGAFTLALLTTFHAAMRTDTTIAFYVLGAMPVHYIVNSKKRKNTFVFSNPVNRIDSAA
jgi:hypothetical protein